MKTYKQMVRSKRELLKEMCLVNWKTYYEVGYLLTELAQNMSEIRFENIIHSTIVLNDTPEEAVQYLSQVVSYTKH